MSQLSHELKLMARQFDGTLPEVAQRLDLLATLAWAQESELQAFRLLEASRLGSRFVSELTSGMDALAEQDEKIIRPDFGKGGRS